MGTTNMSGYGLLTKVVAKTIITPSSYPPTARCLFKAIRLLRLCFRRGGKDVEPVCFFCRGPTIDAYIST
jgi:hypothetical protein